MPDNSNKQPTSWRDQIKVHPAADLFPMMSPDELKALGEDIEQHGLRTDIAVWQEASGHPWFLLDGRNRLDAAETVGLPVMFIKKAGDVAVKVGNHTNAVDDITSIDPYEWVISANVHRRHLTPEQKREVIAALLKANPGKSDRRIAKEADSNRTTVGQIRKELEDAGTCQSIDTRSDTKGRQQPAHKPTRNAVHYSVREWDALAEADRRRIIAGASGNSQFNAQANDAIEWARWSWNPVTGCLHNCDYCYARDIAERFYEQKFEPTFLPDRLAAPGNTKVPERAAADIGYRNVFVCSMADLFGKWVPEDWIDAVFDQVRAHPQWNFLFLTKFPQRLAEREWPVNAWCGTTVDTQARVKIAERAFRDVKAGVRWLSVEPMMERLTFSSLEMFNWIVIGGATKSTQTPAFDPPMEWVLHLLRQAHAAGIERVYAKANLRALRGYPSAAFALSMPPIAPAGAAAVVQGINAKLGDDLDLPACLKRT